MHNFGTVFNFEVSRTLRKPTYWVSVLAVPLLLAVVIGLVTFAGKSSAERQAELEKAPFSLAVLDETGLVPAAALDSLGATRATSEAEGVAQVREGKVDAFYFYPADLEGGVKVFNKNDGVVDNSKYTTVAENLLQGGAAAKAPDALMAKVLAKEVSTDQTVFEDGKEINPLGRMIVPGAITVVLYVVVATFANQMLNSVTEEKENRVTEVLLTTVSPRSVIMAKICSVLTVGLLQIAVTAVLGMGMFLLAKNSLDIPDLSKALSGIQFDPVSIGIGLGVLVTGFLVIIGSAVTIGAMVPTAKEAGSFMGLIFAFLFMPLYLFSMLMSQPESALVRILSFFPLTAPMVLSVRNTFGNLQPWEGLLGIAIMLVFGLFVVQLAVRAFRYGSLEYSRKLSFKTLFAK